MWLQKLADELLVRLSGFHIPQAHGELAMELVLGIGRLLVLPYLGLSLCLHLRQLFFEVKDLLVDLFDFLLLKTLRLLQVRVQLLVRRGEEN